MLHKFLNTVSN